MALLVLAVATVTPVAVGFVIARMLGRGDIVGVVLVLSVPAAAIAVAPVYNAFDDPLIGDDFDGISAVVFMLWLVFWFDAGLLAGWFRSRRSRDKA